MTLRAGSALGPYEIQSRRSVPAGWARSTRPGIRDWDALVAIKVLPADVAADPDVRARFEREAKVVSSLNHPHICALYDVGRQDGIDYLVMDTSRARRWLTVSHERGFPSRPLSRLPARSPPRSKRLTTGGSSIAI